ncbi:MAG: hypothetical protein AB4062_12985 [Crocosphaera sp.]
MEIRNLSTHSATLHTGLSVALNGLLRIRTILCVVTEQCSSLKGGLRFMPMETHRPPFAIPKTFPGIAPQGLRDTRQTLTLLLTVAHWGLSA